MRVCEKDYTTHMTAIQKEFMKCFLSTLDVIN